MKKIACIIAAGKGTRSFHYPYLHKALLPLDNKSVISHCIDSLSLRGIERFIIGCQSGESDQLRSFIENVHHDQDIVFEVCNARDGQYIGPGKTLDLCRKHLTSPFIALGCDTLGEFNVSTEGEWVTISEKLKWDAAEINGEYAYYDSISRTINRGKSTKNIESNPNNQYFTGVIGVEDHSRFWDISSKWNNKKIEKPIYAGLHEGSFTAIQMQNWIDTGSYKSYEYARHNFKEIVEPKPGQEIFIYTDKVIKFFKDTNTCTRIINRHDLLQPTCPPVTQIDKHLISYEYVKGELLSDKKEKKYINKLLEYFTTKILNINDINSKEFKYNCRKMWFTKLEKRLALFDEEMNLFDNISQINGIKVSPALELIKEINRSSFIENCIPCLFHGDPSPENVLFDENNDLRLIDPRPIFGNSHEIGDLYYELAKVDHALLVSGTVIRSKRFGYKLLNKNEVEISIEMKEGFESYRDRLYEFCEEQNWSINQLSLSTALTLLSICTVHSNKSYNNFLLLLGKYFLRSSIDCIKGISSYSRPISLTYNKSID
tara:strand:+ start:628 stop:2262 length:1635 start_codon:yes stop_codon:yes gene_type:complete